LTNTLVNSQQKSGA